MRESEAPARRARGLLLAASGTTGLCCMAVELTAVRLLAPSFGDSAYVWTNVIGVILAALAAGAAVGGRLAGREACLRHAVALLVIAGGLVALVPIAAGPLGQWLLPAELPLDAAMPALVRGSFAATAMLFAPPMLLLGMVSPLLVTAIARTGLPIGRAVGQISAIGTLGSLAGTFAATHWLVPELGSRLTMAIAGGLLVLVGLALSVLRSERRRAAIALLLVGGSAFAHDGPMRAPAAGTELLAEVESRQQFLQVLRARDTGALRLVINEALDSFHSLAIEGSAFTDGAYYDWHALAPLLAGDGRRIAGCTALSIGDAAGSLRRVYAAVHPGVSVDAVDLDGATMKLGERFFPGPKAEGQSAVVDGRVFIARSKRTWHVIHVDAYAHQIYVPAHLASREFFAAVKARLAPGGVIALNVGALEPGDAVLRAIAATLASEFGHAKALLVPNSRNALLVARAGQPLAPALLAAFAFGAERLNANDQEHWRAIVKRAAEPDAWIDLGQAGTVLDDDRPVLDRLLSESYLSREDDGAVLPCRGAVRTEGAEIAAYGARVARDWRAVLRAVESSSAPSAYLRELAGDARWALRQMRCAIAEYEAGVALSEAPESTKRLQERLVQAQEQARPIELAARAAQRNGWLQFGIVVAATVLLFVCWRWRDGSAA